MKAYDQKNTNADLEFTFTLTTSDEYDEDKNKVGFRIVTKNGFVLSLSNSNTLDQYMVAKKDVMVDRSSGTTNCIWHIKPVWPQENDGNFFIELA